MRHSVVTNFLSKLKKRTPLEEEPFVPSTSTRVFGIYELAAMILDHLPVLDLLVVQMVNLTCRDIVNDSTRLQVRLFMKQAPPHWRIKLGANGLRWNPFLEHYGRRRNPEPGSPDYRIKIERNVLQKQRPEASWRRMFLSYPTRPDFHVCLQFRSVFEPEHITSRLSSEEPSEYRLKDRKPCQPWEGDRMGFLTGIDKRFNAGPRLKRHLIMIIAEVPVPGGFMCTLPKYHLRSKEALQSKNIENEGCDERSNSKDP
ncbi:hypothetical protein JMJ35_003938 [Cladonia borealis]|uniref:F-box domain-containing protein n=1 Tax=Cladonia borealis TaxID=184061 RepID=A0AA39R4M8_9LECA|nr:hypothetical protein JMJ35_003938 [Cladonia borealis]